MQGHSLGPTLGDPDAVVRDHVLIEDDLPTTSASRSPIPAKTRTLVTANLKYTRHSTGEDQLFDLAADPLEMNGLSQRDPERRAQVMERLADALIAASDDARGAPFVS